MLVERMLALVGCVLSGLACQPAPDDEVVNDAGNGQDAAALHDAGRDAAVLVDAAPVLLDASSDAASEPTVEGLCGTRTMYPGVEVIDPDDPTYSDASWTNEEVRAQFAEARDADTEAYHAYRTAHARPDLMYCGFCACGCSESIGHESAIDCFKDMHGFG